MTAASVSDHRWTPFLDTRPVVPKTAQHNRAGAAAASQAALDAWRDFDLANFRTVESVYRVNINSCKMATCWGIISVALLRAHWPTIVVMVGSLRRHFVG